MPKPPSVAEILSCDPRLYEISGAGITIRAEGAEDHARALESIGRLSEVLRAMPAPGAAAPAGAAVGRIAIDEAIDRWGVILGGQHRDKPKTAGAKLRAAVDFARWKRSRSQGMVFVDQITRQDCAAWHADLIASEKHYEPRTIENKFLFLVLFFEWARSAGFYPAGDNPARGHAKVSKRKRREIAKREGWQPYTPAQIKTIFNPMNFSTLGGGKRDAARAEAARWIPVILLYTGARSNEVARLELEDIRTEDGRRCFVFDLAGEDKSLKAESSERTTPIHPDLIALGLMERVERLRRAGEKKLFPALAFKAQNGPGGDPQKVFSAYLKVIGVKPRNGRLGHHSFRDTVIQTLKTAEVGRDFYDDYVGHTRDGQQEHRDSYEHKHAPGVLARKCHPHLRFGLDLEALKPVLG